MTSAIAADSSLHRVQPGRGQRRKPVRVLHVLPALNSGGMEWALIRLIRATGATGPEGSHAKLEHGICVLREADASLLAECRSLARVWILGASARHGLLPALCWWRLRRVIRQFQPDIVHARTTGGWFDAAAALCGAAHTQLVLSFHGKVAPEEPGLRRRIINRWCTGRARAVLAVSRDAAEMLRTRWGVAADKLSVLHNGVDVQRFQPATAEVIRTERERLGWSMQHRVVACVASLVPIKAIDVLLRGWTRVQANDPGARLLLIGDGPLRAELVGLTHALGCAQSVHFMGHCRDVAGPLSCADLSVLPSRYEGCSNALLESMACGLPVIACDVGGNRELIDTQRTGWLVAPGAPEELADCIVRLLLDDVRRRQSGSAARRSVVESFSLDQSAAAYARFYQAVAISESPSVPAVECLSCAE